MDFQKSWRDVEQLLLTSSSLHYQIVSFLQKAEVRCPANTVPWENTPKIYKTVQVKLWVFGWSLFDYSFLAALFVWFSSWRVLLVRLHSSISVCFKGNLESQTTVVLSYSLWLRRKEVKVSLRFSWLLQPPSFDPLLYSSQRSTTTTTWLVWYTSSNQVLFYQKPTRRTAIFRKGATTTTTK